MVSLQVLPQDDIYSQKKLGRTLFIVLYFLTVNAILFIPHNLFYSLRCACMLSLQ